MKTIGIIGGLAWPSTVDYYRLLCARTNDAFRGRGASAPYPTPHILLESLDIARMRKMRGTEGEDRSWEPYEWVFRNSFERLQAAGAELGIIASNTPHTRLEGIRMGLALPVVSILDSTAAAVRALGVRRALILGTPVTMRSPMYPRALGSCGIETLPQLDDEVMTALERMIDVELYEGRVTGARSVILDLCEKSLKDRARDVVCLACTELPLAFPEHQDAACFTVDGIRFVNTTVAHVEATLEAAS